MRRILFLCTGNSCRSQMAEGWLRHLAGPGIEVCSAGTDPKEVHPMAVETMQERGVELSGHRSKSIKEFFGQRFDFVITVCDHAKESCPTFPDSSRFLHWSFPDPANAQGTLEEQKAVFRQVRDRIRRLVEEFVHEELG